MGTIKQHLEGLDVSSEVISLIERMLDMINDKDKKLFELQEKIDELVQVEGQLKTSLDNKARKLAESQKQVEDLKTKEKHLTSQVEDKHREFAESQRKVSKLRSAEEQLKYTVDSLNATIHSTVLRPLVEEYKKSGRWTVLKRGMAQVLDKGGAAYRQLSSVSRHHPSPLRAVCSGGRAEFLQVLLAAGLPAGAEDGSGGGSQLLHAAAASGDLRSLQLLLAHGADPRALDAEGRAALHWAAAGGHLELARLLVDVGADPTVVDGNQATPLDLAKGAGHGPLIELLSGRAR